MTHPTQEKFTLESKHAVTLALQGGGAHGAFTWGVLDRLLEEENLNLEGISGTSAGAINGALVAYGLSVGGRKKARQLLENFWRKVSLSTNMFITPSMLDKMMGGKDLSYNPAYMMFDYMTRLMSPYQFNLLDLNPLKDMVLELIDFNHLREHPGCKLFVNATHVTSGESRIFHHEEMTLDMLMASACLPFLFKTVEVDGEPYWDGGYTGNPALKPLVEECRADDIVIVQITPLKAEEVPTSVHDIVDRVNEISFNNALAHEMRYIELLGKQSRRNTRFHRIEAEDILTGLGRSSKFNADWAFLEHLKEAGRQSAEDWLKATGEALGKESTYRLRA